MKQIQIEVRYCVIEKASNKILVMERDRTKAEMIALKNKQVAIRATRITKIVEFID